MLNAFNRNATVRVGIVCVAALVLRGPAAHAQGTFQAIAQGAVANAPGVRAMTIRDASMGVCYTVFTVEGPTLGVPDSASTDSVERVRQLAEQRDRALSSLEARIAEESKGPAPQYGGEFTRQQAQSHYETDRSQLDLQYQRALRHEIPESAPWASATPGVKSGGYEEAANANRRATVDPDPTSVMKTLASQMATQIDLLRLLVEAPRITSSGPFSCPTTTP
jgi:hypothetical protein